MKTISFLCVSLVVTGLTFLAFAFMLDQFNPSLWEKANAGLFLAIVAITDIFILRAFEKQKT